MASTFHTVVSEALKLDEGDRLRLAAELMDSVEGRASPEWESAWAEAVARRTAAADAREEAGEARGLEWDAVRARILQRLTAK